MAEISNQRERAATTPLSTRLTPSKVFTLAYFALVVCVASGAALAIYPKWLQHHREKSGWLPDAADVVAVKAYVRDEEFNEWVPKELPLDIVPEMLELLSRRKLPEEVLPERKKGQPFRLVTYDFTPRFTVELQVSGIERPVRITACRSSMLEVGDEVFDFRRDDAAALEKLVLDHYYADLHSL